MLDQLTIIHWPDPRLARVSKPVEAFDADLRALAARMLELMREARGVGLAAPQVGRSIRLFVMNHTGEPQDDRVYVNPLLTDLEGDDEGEEGCLSLPGITTKVIRGKMARMTAFDLDGRPIDQQESGYIARIWQHETDHLNGVVLLNRMGPLAKLAHRHTIREMEERFAAATPAAPRAKAVR